MLDSLLLRGMTLAALAAGVAAFGLWMDGKAKAATIARMEGELKSERATSAALLVLAQERPAVEIRYRDRLAAVNAAGERTSDACLNDPRVRAAYRALGLRDDADASP